MSNFLNWVCIIFLSSLVLAASSKLVLLHVLISVWFPPSLINVLNKASFSLTASVPPTPIMPLSAWTHLHLSLPSVYHDPSRQNNHIPFRVYLYCILQMHFHYVLNLMCFSSPHESLLKSNPLETRRMSGKETHWLKRCWYNGSFLQWLGSLKPTRSMEFASQTQ